MFLQKIKELQFKPKVNTEPRDFTTMNKATAINIINELDQKIATNEDQMNRLRETMQNQLQDKEKNIKLQKKQIQELTQRLKQYTSKNKNNSQINLTQSEFNNDSITKDEEASKYSNNEENKDTKDNIANQDSQDYVPATIGINEIQNTVIIKQQDVEIQVNTLIHLPNDNKNTQTDNCLDDQKKNGQEALLDEIKQVTQQNDRLSLQIKELQETVEEKDKNIQKLSHDLDAHKINSQNTIKKLNDSITKLTREYQELQEQFNIQIQNNDSYARIKMEHINELQQINEQLKKELEDKCNILQQKESQNSAFAYQIESLEKQYQQHIKTSEKEINQHINDSTYIKEQLKQIQSEFQKEKQAHEEYVSQKSQQISQYNKEILNLTKQIHILENDKKEQQFISQKQKEQLNVLNKSKEIFHEAQRRDYFTKLQVKYLQEKLLNQRHRNFPKNQRMHFYNAHRKQVILSDMDNESKDYSAEQQISQLQLDISQYKTTVVDLETQVANANKDLQANIQKSKNLAQQLEKYKIQLIKVYKSILGNQILEQRDDSSFTNVLTLVRDHQESIEDQLKVLEKFFSQQVH